MHSGALDISVVRDTTSNLIRSWQGRLGHHRDHAGNVSRYWKAEPRNEVD